MNLKFEFLVNSIKARIESQERYLGKGGMRSYDLASDGGYNQAMNHEIDFLKELMAEIQENEKTS